VGREAPVRDALPPLDAALLRQLPVLHVDLLQRLDVLLAEGGGSRVLASLQPCPSPLGEGVSNLTAERVRTISNIRDENMLNL